MEPIERLEEKLEKIADHLSDQLNKLDAKVEKLDSRVEKIDLKVDAIKEHAASVDVTLSKNTESLILHVRRTDLLEEKMQPIEDHVTKLNGIISFFAYIAKVVVPLAPICFFAIKYLSKK